MNVTTGLSVAALTALVLVAYSKQTDLTQDTSQNPQLAEAPAYAPTPIDSSLALPVAPAAEGTIVDVAEADGKFATLLKAASAAGLDDELQSAGPITVFAPTDEAFNALPAGELDKLMQPENKDQLAALVRHHIVEGKVTSDQLMSEKSASTLNGDVAILTSGSSVKVAGASVVQPDVQATNGVVHVIDKVLIPAT